jgi:hypothetical protein
MKNFNICALTVSIAFSTSLALADDKLSSLTLAEGKSGSVAWGGWTPRCA